MIFASDSFYRDHTLHCIWVYFLGQYSKREEQFHELFLDSERQEHLLDIIVDVMREMNVASTEEIAELQNNVDILKTLRDMDEAARCVSALTHDLGYPLKKIEKINKSIKKVLPYFSIQNYKDFSFEYTNVQQEFINYFIDFLSRNFAINLSSNNKAGELLSSILNLDATGSVISVNRAKLQSLSTEEKEKLGKGCQMSISFGASIATKLGYRNDFEDYRHGIMSAFLLYKNLYAFQSIDYNMVNDTLSESLQYPRATTLTLHNIISAISAHTNDRYRIVELNTETFLTFVDELEEFSRISRASQNREYVEEFCNTILDMQDGWLNITFEFTNANLDNLNPEISFKGRCKRFLSLFNIKHLSDSLKLRVTCIGKLPTNQNTYVLEIARKYADIRINGESVDIPKYLNSNQFYTKEDYAKL